MSTQIPVIDWSRWRDRSGRRALAEELASICHDVGFFVVVEHGVDPALIDEMFAMTERLFALPLDVKRTIDKRNSRHFRGWEAVGSERTNNRPDLREQVDIWTEHPARGPDATPAYLRLLGPNQWLADDVLPGHRALVNRWLEAMEILANALLHALSAGLGLEPSAITDRFGQDTMSLLKLIRYPPTPAGRAGVNAHHDTGFVTILAAGRVPGLQIQAPDGAWIDVPVLPEGFVVNLGEMLQAMTGHFFVATPHRVIAPAERHSIGYFHGPSLQTKLERLPLDERFARAVAASPRHANAGYMARKAEAEAGVADMASTHRAAEYGEQLWNYFARSYPKIFELHYPNLQPSSGDRQL